MKIQKELSCHHLEKDGEESFLGVILFRYKVKIVAF